MCFGGVVSFTREPFVIWGAIMCRSFGKAVCKKATWERRFFVSPVVVKTPRKDVRGHVANTMRHADSNYAAR